MLIECALGGMCLFLKMTNWSNTIFGGVGEGGVEYWVKFVSFTEEEELFSGTKNVRFIGWEENKELFWLEK